MFDLLWIYETPSQQHNQGPHEFVQLNWSRVRLAAKPISVKWRSATLRGQNKSSAKSYANGERSVNYAVVRKPAHTIPVDCHRIGPDLISSCARLDKALGP